METRPRLKSESDIPKPPDKLILSEKNKRYSSGSGGDALQVSISMTSPMSPLARDLLKSQVESETSDSSPGSESSKPANKRPALKRCPCMNSSKGNAWLLECTACGQTWHNTCANLKGNIPKTVIRHLDHWQCPWCFRSPYDPPKQHKSRLHATEISSTVLSDAFVTKIEESISKTLASQNTGLMKSIQSDLSRLTEGIKDFAQSQNQTVPQHNEQTRTQQPISSVKLEMDTPQIRPCLSYKENFITEEEAQTLTLFLEQEEFKAEGSRKVASFGERYHYKGAKSSAKPIPDVLAQLVNKVEEKMELDYSLNQILVNKYESAANLPSHSDNEGSIKPDSSIFTVSLGSPGTIEFTHIHEDGKKQLTVDPNSLYEMSRESQNYFKHQVLPNNTQQTRYSITMRSVHWYNYNSTYAVGDSNFGHLEFGSGLGKVGAATPGIRDWAACVKDIQPNRCASYRNVVVMCGTNDLKNHENDILETYQTLKGKVEQIHEINPHGKIFVCPVLPSMDLSLNQRINEFNSYIYHDLQHCNVKVNIVYGFNEFADQNGLLKNTLHDRRTPTDVLHINNKGYRILVRLLKQAIFSVKSKATTTTGMLFSSFFRPT